jgi:hypothetical protein
MMCKIHEGNTYGFEILATILLYINVIHKYKMLIN